MKYYTPILISDDTVKQYKSIVVACCSYTFLRNRVNLLLRIVLINVKNFNSHTFSLQNSYCIIICLYQLWSRHFDGISSINFTVQQYKLISIFKRCIPIADTHTYIGNNDFVGLNVFNGHKYLLCNKRYAHLFIVRLWVLRWVVFLFFYDLNFFNVFPFVAYIPMRYLCVHEQVTRTSILNLYLCTHFHEKNHWINIHTP